MRLSRLLDDVEVVDHRGDLSLVEVSSLAYDTRRLAPGAVFFATPGAVADGHDHASAAVSAGAAALVVERLLDLEVAQVLVSRTRPAMARMAAAFHGHPSRALRVVGVTGTNGKTTVTTLVRSILDAHGWPTGVIGTLSGPRTTPEAPELQAALAGERDTGRRAVAMEVSSEALAQHRADAVSFAVAVFTNLSPEHLNYHGDMEAYFEAKASLFDAGRAAAAVVNADDPWGRRLIDRLGARADAMAVVTWSLSQAVGLRPTAAGCAFTWEGQAVTLPLSGRFNAANAVAAASTARVLGVPAATVAVGLSSAPPIPGRFERMDAGQDFAVVVDFAHTPVALEQLLAAGRELAGSRRVIVVFGCGGERDRSKRPVMGDRAARLADVAVLTTDNPRSEDPETILDEVRAGALAADPARAELVVEPDRRAAIARALAGAQPGDVVLIAGKGHESGQVFADRTEVFDDRQVARELLQAMNRDGAG